MATPDEHGFIGVNISGGTQHGPIAGGYHVQQTNQTIHINDEDVQAIRDHVATIRQALPQHHDPAVRQAVSTALAQVDDAFTAPGPADPQTFLRRLQAAGLFLTRTIETHPAATALLAQLIPLVAAVAGSA
ncbi:hypothetical protein ACFW3D_32085 [Streptomyces sp. NPDC058864]